MLKIRRFLSFDKCIGCGAEFLAFELTKINNKEYVCRDCMRSNEYSRRNSARIGKETQASFSFEFETSSRAEELFELRKYRVHWLRRWFNKWTRVEVTDFLQ